MTLSLPASSGGTGTAPATPSARSCSTWRDSQPASFSQKDATRRRSSLAVEQCNSAAASSQRDGERREPDLSAQQGDVVLGLAGAVGGVQVLADVVAGVGEEHVRHERDGARRALDVQHHALLRATRFNQSFYVAWPPDSAIGIYMSCNGGQEIEDKQIIAHSPPMPVEEDMLGLLADGEHPVAAAATGC